MDITILLQPCAVNLACYILVISCYKLLTAYSKQVTTTGNKQREHNLSTAGEQTCNNLFTDL
jgi:hypothetical protein